MDRELLPVFPGEKEKVGGRLSVIKTHTKSEFGAGGKYNKAILIVRDFKSAILSRFTFKKTSANHTGQLDNDKLESPKLLNMLKGLRKGYRNFYFHWLTEFDGPTLVLRYDDMVSDLYPQLVRIRNFLGAPVSNEQLQCVLCFSEGKFHRKKATDIDPWKNIPRELLQETDEDTKYVENLLETKGRENLYVY